MSLLNGAAAVSTNLKTLAQVKSAITQARISSEMVIPNVSNSRLLMAGQAMQSALMWNVLYEPMEGVFVEVSRSFAIQPYELFEWDTFFGALMLSIHKNGVDTAISSLIQIIKSKTLGPALDGHGFIPGYSKGRRWLAEDRTERPMGSQIVYEIFKRWHSAEYNLIWLLQLLYKDLLDWNTWLWEHRRGDLGLAILGSDPCFTPYSNQTQRWCRPSWGMGQLQGARFESLDNSPMYDAPDTEYEMFNATTYRMRLYDVGQSAAVVAECEALASIATILNQTADVQLLKSRQATMSAKIIELMWDPELEIFTNLLDNGTRY